jgi:hypothetical protein
MMLDSRRALACGLLLVLGCGKPAAGPDAPGSGSDGTTSPGDGTAQPAVDAALLDVPGHTPGMPGLGAHGMKYYHLDKSSASSIVTPQMATQSSGSTIVVSIGRGDNTLFALPTDNKGNVPYQQQGTMHPYDPLYLQSGTALYAFTDAKGGADFTVGTTTGMATTGKYDEITLAAVEVIEGTKIQAFEWNELSNPPLTSRSVTTTGPATLVAFWWGDGYFYNPFRPQEATPDNGFAVVDTNATELDSFVQCVVAVKNVTAPGTYNVTWTAAPTQGAQLWLIAVQ